MDKLTFPNMRADLALCFKQLHEICKGDRKLAVMSVPPQQTDFDMQFHSAFDELQAYRDTGRMPDEIRWIPVNEKIPEDTVIGCDKWGNVEPVLYIAPIKKWKIMPDACITMEVIYWMPLPHPPEVPI